MIWALRAVGIADFVMAGLFPALSTGDAIGSRLAIGIPFALLGVFVLWRPGRACLIADDDTATVRNVFRTTRLRWASIRRFSLTAYKLYPRIAVVELQDGSLVPIWAIQASRLRPSRTEVQNLVDELNQLLSKVRHPRSE